MNFRYPKYSAAAHASFVHDPFLLLVSFSPARHPSFLAVTGCTSDASTVFGGRDSARQLKGQEGGTFVAHPGCLAVPLGSDELSKACCNDPHLFVPPAARGMSLNSSTSSIIAASFAVQAVASAKLAVKTLIRGLITLLTIFKGPTPTAMLITTGQSLF
jgi:hypothetical protein